MSAHSLTDTNGDRGMVKVMGMVLFSLFLLSLFLFSVARLLGVGVGADESDSLMRNALISRIEPVGQVRTSADELPHGEGIEVAAAAERSGEELVNGVCAGCHQSGAGGAPLLGDEEAWAERREEGLDYLVSSVVNGKGSMPARGGSDYSDEEIRRAVQHIALFEEEAPAAESEEAAATEQADAAGAQEPTDPVAVEGEDADSTNDMAADDDAAVDENDMAADEAPPGTGTVKELDPTEESGEAEAEGGAGSEATSEAAGGGSADLVALIGSGEAPQGMADNVKGAVDGVCAGCHIAGAAGAPKLGDVDAWTPRAEMGLAALTESVANGKGAMPARGGSQLTDEEIPVAIEYLISKQP